MDSIEESLKTRWLGRNYLYFDSLTSTNDKAYEVAENKAPMGTVIVANSQTRGRGRRGRQWLSPADDGLWFSLILRPSLAPKDAMALTLVTAVGICRGLDHYSGLGAAIKWPNDIWVREQKLCGILSEMKAEEEKICYVVIGIGVNIRTTAIEGEVAQTAVGMEEVLTEDIDKRELLCRLLFGLETAYDSYFNGEVQSLIEEWEERSFLLNREVEVSTANGSVSGTVLGLSPEGFLRILTEDKKVAHIISGDIALK
ncbi:MAG: biotin--[acetyl-CoA-carboxylase] ligase [Bacillota bacterium]|nr:biotin--[acetyl-CoA-carboxylase] ligase [Bacillota bacterium]